MQGVGMRLRVRVRRAEVIWVDGIVGVWGVRWGYRGQSAKVEEDGVVWCWIFLGVGEG